MIYFKTILRMKSDKPIRKVVFRRNILNGVRARTRNNKVKWCARTRTLTNKYITMCLNPTLMKNKKFVKNKKNRGVVPPVDDVRKLYVPIGCGFCIECRKQKANNWRVRILEEFKYDKNCSFVTLTFNDESLENIEVDILTELNESMEIDDFKSMRIDVNDIATKAIRRFLERWRQKHGKSLKHWLITELGGEDDRIHLHGIIWSKDAEEIIDKWKYGHVYIGTYCNEKTINYITKYVLKTDEKHKEFTGKVLSSKGIGKNYINSYAAKQNRYKDKNTRDFYRLNNGHKVQLPIYYRNKIYTEDERGQLWIDRLDMEVRYVKGSEIDVSTEKGMINYLKAREYHSKMDEQNGNLREKYKFKNNRKIYNTKVKLLSSLTKINKNSKGNTKIK